MILELLIVFGFAVSLLFVPCRADKNNTILFVPRRVLPAITLTTIQVLAALLNNVIFVLPYKYYRYYTFDEKMLKRKTD